MAIGTTTALLIGAGLSAGANAYAASRQAGAAEDAAEIQGDASEQALALEREMYEQDRADNAPYRNLGAFSLGQLGYLTGMPEGWQAPQAAATSGGVGIGPGVPGAEGAKPSTMPPKPWSAEADTTLPGAPGPRGAPRGTPIDPQTGRTLRDLGAQSQTQSSYTRMRAPDGSERDVPADQVSFYEQRGARRL